MAFKNVAKIQCSEKVFQVQNDLRDWELDAQLKPAVVINEKYWISKGISVDPKKIPAEKIIITKDTGDIEKAIKDATDAVVIAVDPIDPIVEVNP